MDEGRERERRMGKIELSLGNFRLLKDVLLDCLNVDLFDCSTVALL